jgi:hypothetical protein
MAYIQGDAAAATSNLQAVRLWMGDSLSHPNTASRVLHGLAKSTSLSWGLLGSHCATGSDIDQTGQAFLSVPNVANAVAPGGSYPANHTAGNGNNGFDTNVIIYNSDQGTFGSNMITQFKPASFGTDWIRNQNVQAGEFRTNFNQASPAALGIVNGRILVNNTAGTEVANVATNHSTGTHGAIVHASTSSVAAGNGGSTFNVATQYWNSPSPTDETGRSANILLRYLRLLDTTGKFGFVYLGTGGMRLSGHAYSDGGAGVSDPDADTRFYNDALLVALYANLPIKVRTLKIGQNGTPTTAQLDAWNARHISAIIAAGKAPGDIGVELISTHDAFQADLSTYNPATEQVKYNNIRNLFTSWVQSKGAGYWHVPMGLEWREKYGNLNVWGNTYLAGGAGFDYIHYNSAGSLQWATDWVALMQRGGEPSRRSRVSMALGVGL